MFFSLAVRKTGNACITLEEIAHELTAHVVGSIVWKNEFYGSEADWSLDSLDRAEVGGGIPWPRVLGEGNLECATPLANRRVALPP